MATARRQIGNEALSVLSLRDRLPEDTDILPEIAEFLDVPGADMKWVASCNR